MVFEKIGEFGGLAINTYKKNKIIGMDIGLHFTTYDFSCKGLEEVKKVVSKEQLYNYDNNIPGKTKCINYGPGGIHMGGISKDRMRSFINKIKNIFEKPENREDIGFYRYDYP